MHSAFIACQSIITLLYFTNTSSVYKAPYKSEPQFKLIQSKATQDALHAHIKRSPIDSVPGTSQCLQPMIAH